MGKIKVRVQAIIFNSNGELLLAKHQKSRKSYWVLPGGGVNFGEKMDEALKRELSEELGIKKPHIKELTFIDEFINENRHVILVSFRVGIEPPEIQTIKVEVADEAIKQVHFFSQNRITESFDTFYPSKDIILELFKLMEVDK
jgi:ADP-ribose pyrophosphatase YjhB (NUDIX family)